MNRLKKNSLLRRLILITIAIPIVYVIGLLVYGTVTDFQPEEEIRLEPFAVGNGKNVVAPFLSLTIWNLGFGGLGRESEFFYDNGHFFFSGGKPTRTPLESVQKNVSGILTLTDTLDSDFYLYQEIDRSSRRSHSIDQVDTLADLLPDYSGVFAENFVAPYVPIPIFEPWHAYGKALSGLTTYSRFPPRESVRLQLPGDLSWPTRVFSLDRCLLLQRYATADGKELVLLNVHNSAYDKNGELKTQQLAFIRDLMLKEYEKGNYVIAGGDWNMCPPYFRFDGFMPGRTQGYTQMNIPDNLFPPEWLWIFDATYPTNRKVKTTYVPGMTFVTLIDFFLVSPNVKVRDVKTIHLDFEYSDHQPVRMEVELL